MRDNYIPMLLWSVVVEVCSLIVIAGNPNTTNSVFNLQNKAYFVTLNCSAENSK